MGQRNFVKKEYKLLIGKSVLCKRTEADEYSSIATKGKRYIVKYTNGYEMRFIDDDGNNRWLPLFYFDVTIPMRYLQIRKILK